LDILFWVLFPLGFYDIITQNIYYKEEKDANNRATQAYARACKKKAVEKND
jgi:hypothetical protein